ncbi:glycosyltransferase [Geodermatophilus sp. URMC 64]
MLRAIAPFRRILEEARPAAVVSTGAGVALSAFLAARSLRIPAHYVESIARFDGPSMTGRIVAGLRLARLYTPHVEWATDRWLPYPSLLSGWEVLPSRAPASPDARPRLFVSLGTIHPYRFDSLVDAVLATGLADERTVWQLGATTRDDLPGQVMSTMTSDEFEARCRAADVVITHAGVGTAITLFEAGHFPVVVPRRAGRREHVDDHQQQIARLLARQGMAAVAEVEDVTASVVLGAAAKQVRRRTAVPSA